MADSQRLFFALWPDAGVRKAIAQAGLSIARSRALGGREIPPERMHLTLLFLGDCTADQRERLLAGAAAVTAPPFDLRLDQAGCFYRSRVFWVGASVAPIGLTVVWRALQQVAAAAGVEPDRKVLVPHVTQARDIRHRIRPVAIEPIVWPVRDFALVHSTLGARPEYHVVSQWPLRMAS